MNKIEGVPFHDTLPNQKHVGNTVSSKSCRAKLRNIAGQAAYYGGMAALGIAGRGFARGAVNAGRAAFYARAGQLAGRAAGQLAGRAARARLGAYKSINIKWLKDPR